jgi:AAA+ ATPase superfamily predicted ATPase
VFVGRDEELSLMEKLYGSSHFECLVLYGRRRMGKTTLINKFIEGKKAIFFSAQEANEKVNLSLFSTLMYDFFHEASGLPSFVDWGSAFTYLAEKAAGERVILALDEFPYLAAANSAIKSILQHAIDLKFKNTLLYIILSGSQIGFMESEILGYKSPLFGRRTAQLQIRKFDYLTAAAMLRSFKKEDILRFYACVGGTPYYLSFLDKNISFEENLLDLYFTAGSYMFDEPLFLLKQELRETAVYNSAIMAIAEGASRLNEIATKIGEDRAKTAKYLDTLISLGILLKEYPFGEDPIKSRKGIYRIADNCFRFWYRFVFPHRTEIEQGIGKEIFASQRANLETFMGSPFEEMCLQYLYRLNKMKRLPFVMGKAGRWWGPNPALKREEEIDIIGESLDKQAALFCECKFQNKLIDCDILTELMEKSQLFAQYKTKLFMLFAKRGFTKRLKAEAMSQDNVILVSADNMFGGHAL